MAHEALDFTPWIAQDENITLLTDAVGLDITVDETESSVGDFNVDIFATETGTDRKIIIENQLEEIELAVQNLQICKGKQIKNF